MGLQRMCRAVKAPFLPQSPNFEAYESKVAAIVLDATDLLVCFIQCLTGRNCSLGRSVVASDVFLACEESVFLAVRMCTVFAFAYSMMLY